LRTKKEVLMWLKEGKKTIDVRKGRPYRGDVAYFISGPYRLNLSISKKETGRLIEIVRADNFRQIIPSASTPDDAIAYLRGLYLDYDGVFTAYHLAITE
jgi:hypothetical protein